MLMTGGGHIQYPKFNVEPMALAKQDEDEHEPFVQLQVDKKKTRTTTLGMTPKGQHFVRTTSVSQVTCTGNLVDEIFDWGIYI
jgi:hypothetical protein